MAFKRRPPEGNVRRVSSNGRSLRGVITSKTGRLVQFESMRERALLLELEMSGEVYDYRSQPVRISFTDENGEKHTYTPDFMVWREDGAVEIHEVTDSRRRQLPDQLRREAAARKACETAGHKYVVHTEETLPGGARLANLLALYCFRSACYYRSAVEDAAREILESRGSVFGSELAREIVQIARLPLRTVVDALAHMIWHGHIKTDFDRLIFQFDAFRPDVKLSLSDEVK